MITAVAGFCLFFVVSKMTLVSHLDATREEKRHPNDFDVLGDAFEEGSNGVAAGRCHHAGSLRWVSRVPVVYLNEQTKQTKCPPTIRLSVKSRPRVQRLVVKTSSIVTMFAIQRRKIARKHCNGFGTMAKRIFVSYYWCRQGRGRVFVDSRPPSVCSLQSLPETSPYIAR